MPESTSDTIIYPNPALSSASNIEGITYTYTNQEANQFDVAIPGDFLTSQSAHVLSGFPRGFNTVTVTATNAFGGNTATCQFTYFRTGKKIVFNNGQWKNTVGNLGKIILAEEWGKFIWADLLQKRSG